MPLTRDLVLQIRAVNRANKALASVRHQIEQIHAATQALNTGQPITGKGMKEMEGQAKRTGRAVTDMNKAVLKTVHTHTALNGAVTKTIKYFDKENKELTGLTKQMTTYKTQTQEAAQKTGMLRGFLRGLTNSTRVSAEGFGKMIANNATWLAGFALLSATIGTIIKLFGDLIDRQNQFVKVSRLVATAIEDPAQRARANAALYQEFTKQLARTGRTSEEVAETQYQLLSAGLSLEQTIQGLGPALDLIDAAMDDVTQTTKLLAGIMNNYGDTMYKSADGSVVFSNSLHAVQLGLSATVTEGEKMAAVSNLLAIAFDKHQAEVNELRDGLKFSIPAARAAGVGLDELTASLVTLEDHMIKSGRAGRSMRIMLSNIVKNPEKMQEVFKTTFDPDEIDPFVSFLQRAGREFDKIPDKAKKLAIAFDAFTTRGADAFLQLVGEGDKLSFNLEEIREKFKQVDRVMAEVTRSSPEKQFRRLWNAAVNLVEALGAGGLVRATSRFAGALATLVQDVAESVNWLTRLSMAVAEHGRRQAEAAKETEGWRGALLRLVSARADIPDEDPLVEALFGENWKSGAKVMTDWVNELLKVHDTEVAVRKTIEATNEETEKFNETIKKAFDANKNFAASMEAVGNVVSSIQIGDQLSSGLITAAEATKKLTEEFAKTKQDTTFEKLDKDIVVFTSNIGRAYNKMEFFGDFVKNTVTAAVEGFQKATEAVSNFETELEGIAAETGKIKVQMAELGGKGASDLLRLANSLGLGANEALKSLSSAKDLTDQVKDLTDEYDKAFYSGAKQEKLVEIHERLSKARTADLDAQERARETVAIAVPLIEKQLQSAEKLARVQKTQADAQHTIATDAARSATDREKAYKAEETAIEKQIKALEEAAKQQAKLSEIRFKQGYQDESSYNRDVVRIYSDTADKIDRLNTKIGNSQKARLDIQIDKEKEANDKLKEAQTALERYDGIIKNIAKAIKDANISEFAGTISGAFKEAQPTLEDVKEEIFEIGDELDRLTSKVHKIQVEKTVTTINESRARGGLSGYSAMTNVSAGEGFVPPSVVKHNLPALQALNQGNAVSARFPIERFRGPSGIDNIETSLPTGSFVVSKRGMDALDRSSKRSNEAFEKRNFQLGGIVGAGSVGDRTQDDPGQNQTSRFDLVLNVGGEERRYPLTGQRTVINDLASELEKQNLVRL